MDPLIALIFSCFLTLIGWTIYFILAVIGGFLRARDERTDRESLEALAEEAKSTLDPELEAECRKLIDNFEENFDRIWDTLHTWKEEHKDEIPNMPHRDRILWTHFVDGEPKPIGWIPDVLCRENERWALAHGISGRTFTKYSCCPDHKGIEGNKLRVLYLLMSMQGKIPQKVYDNDRWIEKNNIERKRKNMKGPPSYDRDILLRIGIPKEDTYVFDEYKKAFYGSKEASKEKYY